MSLRALRGAITVDVDTREQVMLRTSELLEELFERNGLKNDDVVSVFFTATPDIMSAPPAAAARAFGLVDVPLLCAQEMAVVGSLEHCVRLMLHIETDHSRDELQHVFLRGARSLRPDLVSEDAASPSDDSSRNKPGREAQS